MTGAWAMIGHIWCFWTRVCSINSFQRVVLFHVVVCWCVDPFEYFTQLSILLSRWCIYSVIFLLYYWLHYLLFYGSFNMAISLDILIAKQLCLFSWVVEFWTHGGHFFRRLFVWIIVSRQLDGLSSSFLATFCLSLRWFCLRWVLIIIKHVNGKLWYAG